MSFNDVVAESEWDASSRSDFWKVPEIVASIGPTLEKPEDLERAIEAGARWFRFPCGYRQRPHVQNALACKAVADLKGIPVQLLLDLPSSRPRTGPMKELNLAVGDKVLFWDPEVTDAILDDAIRRVPVPGLNELLEALAPNQRIWFCDGRLRFVVDEIKEQLVHAHLIEGTVPLKSSNSLFLPDSISPFATITQQDRALLSSFAANRVFPEWIALSLIDSPEDVHVGRREARTLLGKEVRVMAKFETVASVSCAEDIIGVSDGIMVARGDLGLAVGYVRLPEIQEKLVELAKAAGKPVVVATQVLEIFAETGIPQRSELSDLSLIARQRADGVMLAKETVYSPRPIETIRLAREMLVHETRRFQEDSLSNIQFQR